MDNEGEYASLLLITLDLLHWTTIMIASIADREKGLGHLHEAHQALGQLLEKEKLDFEETAQNTQTEIALCNANLHEDWSDLPPPIDLNYTNVENPTLFSLLAKLNIALAHKATIEDFSENILTNQSKKDLASLETTDKGPAIPFLPSQAIEE